MAKGVINTVNGSVEIEVTPKVYEAAHEAKCSVPQFLQREYGKGVDPKVHGTVFNQLLAQNNMNLRRDKHTGLGSASLRSVLDGSDSAAITRDAVPMSRILAPAALLELVEMNKRDDRSSDLAFFEKMIAVDTSIGGTDYKQPFFDASGADMEVVSRIGQLQVPNIIGRLTVGERAGYIPTYSFGVEVADEAQKALTFDQVAIYLSRVQMAQESARMDMHINSLVTGDVDLGTKPLEAIAASTFDTVATGGKLTHRAYLKWLRANRRLRTVDYILCDEDTYFKVIDREGRPKASTVHVEDKEIHAYDAKVINYGFSEPQIFIVNNGVIPTNQILGIDSRFAIARYTNSEANYRAAEDLIMRRGTQMRFDSGEVVTRLDENAFTLLKLQ